MSFDELRAKARGWYDRDWTAEAKKQEMDDAVRDENFDASLVAAAKPNLIRMDEESPNSNLDSNRNLDLGHTTTIDLGQTVAIDLGRNEKVAKPKKMKIKEVNMETQTSKSVGRFGASLYLQKQSKQIWPLLQAQNFAERRRQSPL